MSQDCSEVFHRLVFIVTRIEQPMLKFIVPIQEVKLRLYFLIFFQLTRISCFDSGTPKNRSNGIVEIGIGLTPSPECCLRWSSYFRYDRRFFPIAFYGTNVSSSVLLRRNQKSYRKGA